MAKARQQISRGAQRAMLALGLILFLGLVLLMARCVMSTGSDRILPASGNDYGEIAQLGDETMLLENGSTGSNIHKWAMTGKGVHTFTVDDAIFEPGSATISPDGKVRLGRFVKLVDAHPGVSANIIIAGIASQGDGQQMKLLEARAQQLRKELLSNGVRARTEAQAVQLPAAHQPAVYIALSNRAD